LARHRALSFLIVSSLRVARVLLVVAFDILEICEIETHQEILLQLMKVKSAAVTMK